MIQTTSVQRMTRQRRIILDELRKVTSHPTADELFRLVRRRLPRISLGTVYRNLDLLARAGFIQKLDVGGTQKRFDGNARTHYHKRCIMCGRTDDVWIAEITAISRAARSMVDYEIISCALEFIGFCPDCRKRDPGMRKQSAGKQKGERT